MLDSAVSSEPRYSLSDMLEFMSKTLPCIIRLAIELQDKDPKLPMKLKQPKYLSHSLITAHSDVKIKGNLSLAVLGISQPY